MITINTTKKLIRSFKKGGVIMFFKALAYLLTIIVVLILIILGAKQHEDCGQEYSTTNIFIILTGTIPSIFIVILSVVGQYAFVLENHFLFLLGISLFNFLLTSTPLLENEYGYSFSDRYFLSLAVSVLLILLTNIFVNNYFRIHLSEKYILFAAISFLFVIQAFIVAWNKFFPKNKIEVIINSE